MLKQIPSTEQILEKVYSDLKINNLEKETIKKKFEVLVLEIQEKSNSIFKKHAFELRKETIDKWYMRNATLMDEYAAKLIEKEFREGGTRDIILAAKELSVYALKEASESFANLEMSLNQSSKTRGGQTFQKTIIDILSKCGFDLEDTSSKGKFRVDITLPNKKFYEKYPDKTMLISVKRTLRERAEVVISEAVKSKLKPYLITMDDTIPITLLELFESEKLFMYLKKDMYNRHKTKYSCVRSYADLIRDLEENKRIWDKYNPQKKLI